ncbi:MAG: hypothetical protein H6Q48_4862 [Deltaproteobacteria bacterium]|nr:hypothetical protein [Deltaproteobacteria bacterium]
MPVATVFEVEGHCVSGEQTAHQRGDGHETCLQEKMRVIRKESPCKTSGLSSGNQVGETIQEILPVRVIAEYLPAFNPSDDDVMKRAGCVYSGFSGHVCTGSIPNEKRQFTISWTSP